MTEVVTSYAASSQFNLSAHRRQASAVSETNSYPATPTPTAEINALQSVLAAADKAESQSFSSSIGQRDAGSGASSGPSRPRVEITRFDVGLSPSEVVGTPDVLLRFDTNGDGRVDMMEASKAAQVRQDVFTFAGLAAAPPAGAVARLDTGGASSVPAPVAKINGTLSEYEAPALARETGAALAAVGSFSEVGLPKKFTAAAAEEGAKKFYDAAAAIAGAPSGTADAPKKYYGQGAEIVAGQASAGSAPQPVKYSDRAPAREQGVAENGTGETKYYDRVAQAEDSDANGGSFGSGRKYADRAQEIAATLHGKPVPEVSAYTQAEGPVDVTTGTIVTA